MDVNFYDFEFNHLAVFPRSISVNFELKYCGFGAVEVHFSLAETEVITLLQDNPYMIFTVGDMAAIVTGFKVSEEIEVFGRTPEWLLTKRGVLPFEKTASAEEIVRSAVVSSAEDFVALGEFSEVGEVRDYKTDKVRLLYDVVVEVLEAEELGFRLRPDFILKTFVFEVFRGEERIALISLSNRTAYDMVYLVDKQDMVTKSGWYERKILDMGGWDAYNNSPSLSDKNDKNAYTFYEITSETYYQSGGKYYPVEVFGLSCPKGLYLYSDTVDGKWKVSAERPDTVWVYIENPEVQGFKKWDAVLSGTKTEAEAIEEIRSLTVKEKSESEIKSLEYGKDYSLGDIVRVQFEFQDFKKTQRKRVSSVNIYFDVDKSGITPVFSNVEE